MQHGDQRTTDPSAPHNARDSGEFHGRLCPGYGRANLHPTAFVHPDAVVIGNVTIGADSTVWPSAVLRGDYGLISVGERTSIQDGTVVHATAEHATVIGSRCVVGHLAHLEGCTVEDDVLIGSGSVVLHRAVVRSGALVGAGAVVPNGLEVPRSPWHWASRPSCGSRLLLPVSSTRQSSSTSVTVSATDRAFAGSTEVRRASG